MKLKRTKQCAKCPWKKATNPHDIPHGYSVEKHKGLKNTIASGDFWKDYGSQMHVMACHEDHESHCIGWLMNQLGPGNNIPLRIAMRGCENLSEVRTFGQQHHSFEDTLPEDDT